MKNLLPQLQLQLQLQLLVFIKPQSLLEGFKWIQGICLRRDSNHNRIILMIPSLSEMSFDNIDIKHKNHK